MPLAVLGGIYEPRGSSLGKNIGSFSLFLLRGCVKRYWVLETTYFVLPFNRENNTL